jgi:hypothetical protein
MQKSYRKFEKHSDERFIKGNYRSENYLEGKFFEFDRAGFAEMSEPNAGFFVDRAEFAVVFFDLFFMRGVFEIDIEVQHPVSWM